MPHITLSASPRTAFRHRPLRTAALLIALAAAVLPGPAISQSAPRSSAEMVAAAKEATERMSLAGKSDYYIAYLSNLERVIAKHTEVAAELPDIQKRSVAAGTQKFPDVAYSLTKADIVAKLMFNASGIDVADRPAYFQLIGLNIASLLARLKVVKLEVEAIADAEDPAIVPRAREAAADSMKIEAFIDEYRKTGSQAAIASAEVLATTRLQKEMIAKAQSVPVAAPSAAPKPVACRDNGDGTLTGTDGTIWQLCLYGQTYQNGECTGTPQKVGWYEAMEAARSDRFLGHKDWILPSTAFFNGSIHPTKCIHPKLDMHMKVFNAAASLPKIGKNLWTAHTNAASRHARVTDAERLVGTHEVYFDTHKATNFPYEHYPAVYAVFIRNAPSVDVTRFDKSLELVAKCDKACRDERRARK
ncbi:MAG: hypothetical protein JNL99_05930 [Zoogloea sp.]|nr:hypothetical protein [Zoogloea sp.]